MTQESVVSLKKRHSKQACVSFLYTKGASTLSTLAKSLRISIPSATAIVQELILENWIVEIGAMNSKFGRKPTLFDINPVKKTILILDIGVFQTELKKIDLRNQVTSIAQIDLLINDPDFTAKLLPWAKNQQVLVQDVWGIGITSPGLIEKDTLANHTYVNHQASGKSLVSVLQELWNAPAFIINDTKASLLGETRFGLARNKKNVMLLNMDWGIGLGVLSNGEILQGNNGFAGEIGHIQVIPGGELCHCGKVGCLETVASVASLLRKAQNAIDRKTPTKLQGAPKPLTLPSIIEAAHQGDEFTIELIYELGRELGKGLSFAVHLLNPELILIDGLLTSVGNNLTSAIEQSLNKYCLRDFKNHLQVITSPLGETAKTLGAKHHIFEKLLHQEFQDTL